MSGKLLLLSVLFFAVGILFADEINTTIEINGVTVNGGLVYVAVYSNENDYKNETHKKRIFLSMFASTLIL